MSKVTIEIPFEVWEHCQRDAEQIALFHRENIRLQLENARLRKAGDNLARASDENGCHDNGDADDLNKAIKLWNAAKEGKQS